jgi:hypothetical protein
LSLRSSFLSVRVVTVAVILLPLLSPRHLVVLATLRTAVVLGLDVDDVSDWAGMTG